MARKIVAPEASVENKVTNIGDNTEQKTNDSRSHRSALAKIENRHKFITVADQIAEDMLFFARFRWPDSEKYFPDDADAKMRFVSRYYPYASGGPLYVDEPKNLIEVDRCEVKRKIMKKMKLRYVVINRQYETEDGLIVEATKLSEALEQL